MIIVLDPGHVKGYNRGYAKGYFEGTRQWEFAQVLASVLRGRGHTVYITRDKVTDDPNRTARGKFGAAKGADIFLSLHTNAPASASKVTVQGVTVFYSVQRPSDKTMAEKMLHAMAKCMGTKARSAKTYPSTKRKGRDYYTVVDSAAYHGCKHVFLIESGFHTNPYDCQWWMSDENLVKAAKTLADVMVGESATADAPVKVETAKTETTVTKGVITLNFNTLRRGDKGGAVKAMQYALKGRGHDLGQYGVDGDFGSATLKAVKEFQRDEGLVVDGVVGQKTFARLYLCD